MKEVEELSCPFCGYVRPRVAFSSGATDSACPRCGHLAQRKPEEVVPADPSPSPAHLLSDLEIRAIEIEHEKLELEQWLDEETRQADEAQSRVSMVNLREKIGRLARQHRGAGERLHLLRSEYQGLQTQLETVASNVERYAPDPIELDRMREALREQFRDAEVERLEALIKQLEEKLSNEHGLRMTAVHRIEEELSAASRRTERAEQRVAELEREHDRAEFEHSVVAKLEEANRELQAERSRIEQDNHRVHEQWKAERDARRELDLELSELRKQADQLVCEKDADRARIQKLAGEVQDLMERLERANRLREQADHRAHELEAQPRADPVLEATLQELKARNSDLLDQRSRLEEDLARSRNQLRSRIEEADRFVRQADAAEDRCRRLQDELEAAQTRSSRLREIVRELRTVAESVPPLEDCIQVLERENHALNAQVQEAQRSLSDAATVVRQVSSLRSELERLGTRYLHAREELARSHTERLNLRDELSDLADRVLRETREESGYSAAEIARARRHIRKALEQHLRPGRVDIDPDA